MTTSIYQRGASSVETAYVRRSLRCLLLALALTGCAQDPELHERQPAIDGGTVPVAMQPAPDPATVPRTPPCPEPQRAAMELLHSAQACMKDEDCAFREIDAPCLEAFLCGAAVSGSADLDALRARARELSQAYRSCTGACPIMRCVGTREVRCNPASLQCELAS